MSVEELNNLSQITQITPGARPTLKTHKNPLKVRLIINTKGSTFYKIAKLVSRELKPLTISGKSYIKDSEDFINKIKNETLQENERIVSFDISDMYPSLSRKDVVQEAIRRVNTNEFKPNIPKETLIRLIFLSTKFMTFKINNKIYEQAEGLFIGSPASPCLAEIYIQRLEEISIYKMIHAPRIWLRKVDDTFAITHHSSDIILNELNKINENISFTAEEEKEEKMAFLDCYIKRNGDNKIETAVYKKETHTGQYSNFHSNQPLSVRLSTMKSLTRRANRLCSKHSDKEKEIQYINRTMQLNDFPKRLVEKSIENSIKNDGKKRKDNGKIIENTIKLFLPYEKGITEKIARIGAKYNVSIIHINNTSLKNKVNYKRAYLNKTEQQGVVYQVQCLDCDMMYIGETGRKLDIRLKEHKNGGKNIDDTKISGLSSHIKNTGHNIDWENTKVLCKEQNHIKRKFKEGLEIKKCKGRTMNKKEESKIISDIWENVLY